MTCKRWFIIGGLLIVLNFSGLAHSEGKELFIVKKVIDGDSLYIENIKEGTKEARLWGIDSPEWNQPYGRIAKKYVNDLIGKRRVTVVEKGEDKYGRTLVILFYRGKCINDEIVKNGYGWVHPYYCRTRICKDWRNSQNNAKIRRKGLWKQNSPESPWSYKKNK